MFRRRLRIRAFLRLVDALVLLPHFRRLLVRRNETIKSLAESAGVASQT